MPALSHAHERFIEQHWKADIIIPYTLNKGDGTFKKGEHWFLGGWINFALFYKI